MRYAAGVGVIVSSSSRASDAPPADLIPVLVVDDEEAVRMYVSRVLKSAGFNPVTAVDGPDALAKMVGLTDCPLLLTDLMMPGMPGDELARQLRQRLPDIKVLYMTGFADRLFSDRSLLWEGEAFLEKPFTPKGLLEAIALLLTGHPQVSALPRPPKSL